jgi:hypothetical protein
MRMANHILMILESVKMVAHLSGLQGAMKQSKAIARGTEDSMTVNSCMKKVWAAQAWTLFFLALNQNMPSRVTSVEMHKPRSVAETIERK